MKIKEFCVQKAYLKRAIKVKVIPMAGEVKSMGDVLRQVSETKGLITDEFVLIRGDVVSNIDLRPAIKMHYDVREWEA